MKQNDWIVASINNPTYDYQDFRYLSGLTLDNTQLLPEQDYLNSQFIQSNDQFKDKDGNFNKDKFHNYYQAQASKFSEFSAEDEVDNYEYDMFDVLRPKEGKVKDNKFNLSKEANPQHISIGIAGINEVQYSDKSLRELAQDSKIYDPATGQYLDKSVNDISLFKNPIEYFKSLFDEPLVYATYDEDTEEIDPETGNKVLHKKGEWKVNENGEYYVEKLNGRSLIGKQVVSSLDYLTPDNSGINKYDFMDSDGLDKSAGGIIAKNVVSILPLLNPYTASVYSGLLVGRELAKSLPMLYGIIGGLSGSANPDSKLLNTIAAYGDKFTGSTSDYAQQNMFSFENIGNLMSDVAAQWGQQRFIGSTFQKLTSGSEKALKSAQVKALKEYEEQAKKGIADAFSGKLDPVKMAQYVGTNDIYKIQSDLINTGKWADTLLGKAALNKYIPAAQKIVEKRLKTGQDLSLLYMALISNTDVYESILEKGGTPFEAASIALGSMIGMFSVDKYLGLGELFFNDEPSRKALRQAVKNSADTVLKGIKEIPTNTQTKKGIVGLIQKGIDSGKKAVQNYSDSIKNKSLGFVGKSLGEGLEEVSEEIVSDISKTLGELAGQLGYFSQNNYGSWDNAVDRYLMSFLGGSLGGGMFYGVDVIRNRNSQTKDLQTDLIYLLRQGRKNDILAEIDRLKKQGKLGSKNLSYNPVNNNGEEVYLTVNDEKDSQSSYVYNTLVNTVNQLDLILNENKLNLTDDQLFDKMVQGEYRALALSDFLKGDKDEVKDISYITKYQEEFQKLTENIANKEAEIQEYISKTIDPQKRTSDFQEKLNELKAEKQELIDYKNYLFGEGSLGYVEKMLFAMDTNLSGQFLTLNYNQFIRQASMGKDANSLTKQELDYYNSLWEQYNKSKKFDLDQAFKLYKQMEKKINPSIQEISDNIGEWQKQSQQFIDSFRQIPDITYDSRLEGESDEQYNNRSTKLEGESDEQYQNRVQNRNLLIKAAKEQAIADWINSISSMQLDRNQFRVIESQIQTLKRNKVEDIVRTLQLQGNPELTRKIQSLIETSDLKDINSLKKSIKDIIKENIDQEVSSEYSGRAMYSIEDWGGFHEKLEELNEPNTEYLTYGDLYKIVEDYIKNNPQAKETDLVTYLQSLSNPEMPIEFDETSNDKQTIANVDFLKWYPIALINDEIREQKWTTPIEVTQKFLDNETNSRVNNIMSGSNSNGLDSKLNDIIDRILNDPLISSLSTLENKTFSVNPVSGVVDTISKISTNSNTNIHEFLEQIYSQYQNGESAQSFQLTEQQEKVLLQFIQDLKMSQAFIHAASVNSDYNTPVGHNKAINQFINNHKEVFNIDQALPEISEDYANFLLNEVNSFIREASNWLELSRINTGNKTRKFTTADQKYNKAVLEFFKINRDGFKVNSQVDLLEGYEEPDGTNDFVSVVKIQQLLHNNYLKAIEKGLTIEQILDSILTKVTNINELQAQLSSKLDENLNYSKLTSYDKLNIIISCFALSPKKYYSTLSSFIEANDNIAPLAIQEIVAKTVLSQQSNPELINRVLNYLQDKLKLTTPVLENTSIVLGLGGAGKSAVIAKMAASDGENVWLSGPTQTQITNLINYLPKGQGKTKDELLTLALGSEKYTEFKNSIAKNKNGQWTISKDFGYVIDGLDGTKTVQLSDSVKINKISNAPRLIIIDEATHFNTAELQIISKFAKLNNIQVLLLGDDHQNGSVYTNLMMNLDREVCLSWRAPKLFISLRDNNVQKGNNLQYIINLIDQMDEAFSANNEENVAKQILDNAIPKYNFNYYNKDTFNGELITDTLSDDLINKLSGEIGFIGSPTSDSYKKLQEVGKAVTLVDPLSVQGQEFDYVIVDKDWNLNTESPSSLYFFLRDLYTMISRSRNGTILINRGDLNKFHSVENELTGTTSIKSAISMFREQRAPLIKNISETLEEYEIQKKEDKNEKQDKENPEENPNEDTAGIIQGTSTTEKQLEQEKISIKDNSTLNIGEVNQANSQSNQVSENMTTPIRCYSNVSYSGLPLNEVWTNNSDIKKDLGIFIRKGDIVKEGNDKKEVVKKVLQMKSVFNYGISNWNLLPRDIQERFSEDSFSNAEYYISVEDPSDNNVLIGLTDLDNNQRTINGKVITLVAKIKDRNNQYWELTLGGLANPYTWEKNEDSIIKNIKRRIENSQSITVENTNQQINITIGESVNSEIWNNNKDSIYKTINKELNSKHAIVVSVNSFDSQLQSEPYVITNLEELNQLLSDIQYKISDRESRGTLNSQVLQDYIDNLHSNIINYKNRISELSKTNQEFRINSPQFSGLTTLVNSNQELRLESIDPDSDASPFDAISQYAVKSDVYVLTGNIPGVNPKLKGKPVMYVSSNILLNSSQLKDLYEEQKRDPSLVPQVRMIVLDNLGVSFDSLYKKKYKDIYTTSQGGTKYYFPIESEPAGLRMYKAIWNFRSNLQNFLKAYDSFREESGLTEDDIIKLCKLDNEQYTKLKGDSKYLSEEEYRNNVDEQTKQTLKPIWDFNDSLKDYREFRLGYSSKNGAYLRKLTNLSEDGPYQGMDINDIIGIYINPDLARQYSQVLDNLFNNILEKIVPSNNRDPRTYITKELQKGWFRNVLNNKKISINIVDYSEDPKGAIKTGTLDFNKEQSLSAILPILVETAKFLKFKSLGSYEFTEYLQQNQDDRYKISFDDENLDWYSIDSVFESDRPLMDQEKTYDYSQFAPGINPYAIDPDTKTPKGIIDDRISNLFSLMFHGLTSTRKYNDFTKGDIRATDAQFKFGFFVDPVLAPKQEGSIENNSVLTITNKKLFGTKVYPGLPIIGISLNPYQGESSPAPESFVPQSSQTTEEIEPQSSVQNIIEQFTNQSSMNLLQNSGIFFSEEELEEIKTSKDFKDLAESKIYTNFKKFWSNQSTDINEISQLPVEVQVLSDGKSSVVSLQDSLKEPDNPQTVISDAYWSQGTLVITTNSGQQFKINYSPYGPITEKVEKDNGVSVANTSITDLGEDIKNIITEYTQPNNEDGLDEDTSSQLIILVDRLIKRGRTSEDISIETKNRIINQIQEALENTDLENEINNALSKLKNVCKLI